MRGDEIEELRHGTRVVESLAVLKFKTRADVLMLLDSSLQILVTVARYALLQFSRGPPYHCPVRI